MSTDFIDFTHPENKLKSCDFIILDTCSIFHLAANQADAIKFAKFTLTNDIMLCYTIKSVEELNIVKESQCIPQDKRIASPNMPQYLQNSQQQVNAMLNTLHQLPNIYPEPIGEINSTTITDAQENALKHTLRWGDAMIYTLAKQNDCSYIWTYDRDWKNMDDDNMTILTEGRFIPTDMSQAQVKII
jgi:hypothetical protein